MMEKRGLEIKSSGIITSLFSFFCLGRSLLFTACYVRSSLMSLNLSKAPSLQGGVYSVSTIPTSIVCMRYMNKKGQS